MILADLHCAIDADAETVFNAVADPANYGRVIPEISNVELVSDITKGVGTRFRETRRLTGFQGVLARLFSLDTNEIECAEFVENKMVRYVNDDAGISWHSVFTVTPLNGGSRTRLDVAVEARPYNRTGRLLSGFMKDTVKKHMGADLDAVKTFCEGR